MAPLSPALVFKDPDFWELIGLRPGYESWSASFSSWATASPFSKTTTFNLSLCFVRGTQFRQWAIGRFSEYLVTGFTMDDERLKNPPGKGQKDYFDEPLECIRNIWSSERRYYQKVLDVYALIPSRWPIATESRASLVTCPLFQTPSAWLIERL